MRTLAKLKLEQWSDDELLDKLTGSKITFSGYLSDAEQTVKITSRPIIRENERGRFIQFTSEAGVRFVQLEKIKEYRKR